MSTYRVHWFNRGLRTSVVWSSVRESGDEESSIERKKSFQNSQQIRDCQHESRKKIRKGEADSNDHSLNGTSSDRSAPKSETENGMLQKSVQIMTTEAVKKPKVHWYTLGRILNSVRAQFAGLRVPISMIIPTWSDKKVPVLRDYLSANDVCECQGHAEKYGKR